MSTRYILHDEIGAGGMAKVHIGRLLAPLGFSRVVAIKRLHPQLSLQPDAVAMLVDEARIAARVRHPNVIPTLDVLMEGGECLLVMEYVEGESLARLLRASSVLDEAVPVSTAVSVIASVLHGLHAAHTARSAQGEPLAIMHRDVSPQNILVGVDGVVRIFDFGIAKALGRLHETRTGKFKGKLAYVAPEQLNGEPLTQRVDIYAASVVLWECLTLQRLFQGESEEATFGKVMRGEVPVPSSINPLVPRELDGIVLRGLSRAPGERFASAQEMAEALEAIVPTELPRAIGGWVQRLAAPALAGRAALVAAVEKGAPERPHAAHVSDAPSDQTVPLTVFERPSAVVDEPNAPTSLGGTTQSLISTGGKRRRVSGVASAALALLVLGAGAAFGFAQKESQAVAVAATRDGAPANAIVAPSEPPPPSLSAVRAAPTVEPLMSLLSVASVRSTPPPSAAPKRAAVTSVDVAKPAEVELAAPKPAVAKPAAPKPAVAKDPCSPPYVVVKGIKRFKERCF